MAAVMGSLTLITNSAQIAVSRLIIAEERFN